MTKLGFIKLANSIALRRLSPGERKPSLIEQETTAVRFAGQSQNTKTSIA
jgi:hypothetical protein